MKFELLSSAKHIKHNSQHLVLVAIPLSELKKKKDSWLPRSLSEKIKGLSATQEIDHGDTFFLPALQKDDFNLQLLIWPEKLTTLKALEKFRDVLKSSLTNRLSSLFFLLALKFCAISS